MSLEFWNTVATFGTLVVIAVTAIAATVQLRFLRRNNQIAYLNELRKSVIADDFLAAVEFIARELPDQIQDSAFRYELAQRGPALKSEKATLANRQVYLVSSFYESMGATVAMRLVDSETVIREREGLIIETWRLLEPVTVLHRRAAGEDRIMENFEYLVVLANAWRARHPDGAYPKGVARLHLVDQYREADAICASSRSNQKQPVE
jgi:hypothetical protein